MAATTAEPPSTPRPAASASVLDAKRALRARILRERDAIPAASRDAASAVIAASIAIREDFVSSATVLLTLPFGSEWDTRALVAAALARSKTVALPRVNRASQMLDVCAITHIGSDVAPGHRGIPEPGTHCALLDVASIDWVLVPGVAFDSEGGRMGYGGGYYDRLLPLLRRDTHRIAGAFELQLVGRVPAASHDVPIDAIVTETRTVWIAR